MKHTAPFIHQGSSSAIIMWLVIACLVPIVLAQSWLLSFVYLANHAVVIVAAVVFECGCVALRKRRRVAAAITDGSIIVAAIILAYGMPPAASWHVLVIASLVMVLVKHMYGGLGMNIFNPAMTAYACALVMFPSTFSHWPHLLGDLNAVDAVSQATPLFTGTISQGEQQLLMIVQAIIIASGCLLLIMRIVKWHVPVLVLVGFVSVCSVHAAIFNQPLLAFVWLHLLSGALVFAAFFVVTDPVELPRTRGAQMLYAGIIGVLIAAIRLYGSYPEGVAFAVLLGNMISPLLNHIEQCKRGVVIE